MHYFPWGREKGGGKGGRRGEEIHQRAFYSSLPQQTKKRKGIREGGERRKRGIEKSAIATNDQGKGGRKKKRGEKLFPSCDVTSRESREGKRQKGIHTMCSIISAIHFLFYTLFFSEKANRR